MLKLPRIPVALTIAGSDSGGGAGIQADLKVFAALGVHGVSAVTSVTAQTPRGLTAVQACLPRVFQEQLRAVAAFKPAAAKTGMLLSATMIRHAAGFAARHKAMPLVVDPVMVATSGARLLEPGAVRTLTRDLLPRASLVTPNVAEAEVLTGARIRRPEDLRAAARALHGQFGCAALVKGGHLPAGDVAIDLFFDGATELLLEAPRARGIPTHGTGCTYAAAIVGHLALGKPMAEAVIQAKEFVTQAIHGSVRAGPFAVLATHFRP